MKSRGPFGLPVGLSLLLAGSVAGEVRLTDVTDGSGIETVTWCGREEKPHILESNGTGLALWDYDGDGDLDLYLVNGWRLRGAEILERGRDALYRNEGGARFREVTDPSGLGQTGWGSGVASADVDGDGFLDLFVTNFGPDLLYRNRTDGTFEVIPGAPSIDGWSTGAAFFDGDGDGDLDLLVAGYIDCTLEEVLQAKPELYWQGLEVMLGPFGLEGLANRFWRNSGGWEFEEATEAAGLADPGLYYSFGVLVADLDLDRDLDVYVANDSNPNYLYRNDGTGRFQEMGLWSGAALDSGGNAQAGMGVAAGDVNRDGTLDLLVTNFWKDASTLYLNRGDLIFEDATMAWGLFDPTYLPLSWGVALADFDTDSDLDALIANGHIYPQADQAPEADTSYRQPNLLLESTGQGFRSRGPDGLSASRTESSRGLATGDLDGDGDVDAVVSNVDAKPTVLRNESPSGGWLVVDAPQASRVAVTDRGTEHHQAWTSGGSYLSVSDPRFHFGLGDARGVYALRVEPWRGLPRVHRNLPRDRVVVVRFR